MKIAIASDLHLEFCDIDLKNTDGAEVLLLAGDIMVAEDLHDFPAPIDSYVLNTVNRAAKAQRYRDFLERINKEFPVTLMVAGNHEFYHGKWDQTLETMRSEVAPYENIRFLENDIFDYNGVRFIGSTLWTDMDKQDPLALINIKYFMNDFKVIKHEKRGYKPIDPMDTVMRHIKSLKFIYDNSWVDDIEKIVVVSHHAPTFRSIGKDYVDHDSNPAYASDLAYFICNIPEIKLWAHGHIHSPSDYMVGDYCRVVANPRGYASESYDTYPDYKVKIVNV